MNIALIAHDTKKELMVQFCIAYCGVLSRNTLCATGTTGKQATWIQFLGDLDAIRPPKPIDMESAGRGYSPVHYNIGGRPVGIRTKGLHIIKGKKRMVR